jgi:hypothetical protein
LPLLVSCCPVTTLAVMLPVIVPPVIGRYGNDRVPAMIWS